MVIHGHSRSRILGSIEIQRRTTYYYIIMLALSCEDSATESTANRRFRSPHCRLTPLLQETRANVRINLIQSETRFPAGLHFAADSMGLYLHWNFRCRLWKTHELCSRVSNGRSRLSKVVDWFRFQSKAPVRVPISDQQQPWYYLGLFLRYGDLLADNRKFSTLHSLI